MNTAVKNAPLCIRMHAADNVAIVVNDGGLQAGAVFADGLVLTEAVPQGHKVALRDLAEGDPVTRYNVTIGYAAHALARGSWVTEAQLRMPPARELTGLPMATRVGPAFTPLEGYTFEGYRNEDGSVGTRNILAITTTVQCVAGVVEHAVARIKAELLPIFPHVDDVIGLEHTYGCGVAIDAPGAEIPIRTLRNISQNPNFGGQAMVVSLGCEKLQPARLFPAAIPIHNGRAPAQVCLQDAAHVGFSSMVDSIMATAMVQLAQLDQRRRVTCPASELVVGVQCGGSDAFSGVTANPAVGYATDLLVRAGATVMFSEVTEVRDGIDQLTSRAASAEVAQAMIREMAWYDAYLTRGGVDRSANTTPGNKLGGLSNIVEKAMGSIVKSGTMHLHVFTTGRGTPYGLAAVPVIKVATRDDLARRWHDLMDVNAGRIATGEASIEEVGMEMFKLMLDVASGRKTWAEHWKLHNALVLFNPAPIT
jgi:galactarate dehydratase